MQTFGHLSKIRAFERAHLTFLVTIEDFDIVRVIGLHQERAEPLLLKQLYLEGIGSIATVTRRLSQLRTSGHVIAQPYGDDRRAVTLVLSTQLHGLYLRYGKLLISLAQ
ncbi:MAG: hypothetical protein ABI905_11180 [Betaproteobacteria bacterium]